jgi:PTS system galactitol-specific IIA component
MKNGKILLKEFTNLNLLAGSDSEALEAIFQSGLAAGALKDSWLAAVLERESHSPTGLPTVIPVAIPHTDAEHALKDGIGFFRLIEPVEFGEMGSIGEKIPVQLIIPLVITDPKEQLDLLMAVIGLVQDTEKMKELVSLTELPKVAGAIDGFLASELGG